MAYFWKKKLCSCIYFRDENKNRIAHDSKN